jgi:sugar/nucleoside kinase (ribokinase family)
MDSLTGSSLTDVRSDQDGAMMHAAGADHAGLLQFPSHNRLDLLAVGSLFLDVVYGPVGTPPEFGHEIFSPEAHLLPGGIANFTSTAVALGARTGLAAVIGDGAASRLTLDMLEKDRIDTSRMVHVSGWDVPVTSAFTYNGDRALVTGGMPTPLDVHTSLQVEAVGAVALHLQLADIPWLPKTTARVFGDVGWDDSGRWDRAVLRHLEHCEGFLPNLDEAQAYTRTDTPLAAARALSELVPIVVVTCGEAGAIAIDSRTSTEVSVPALHLGPVDPTGAGDTFGAAFILALTAGWGLRDAVEFGTLTATARAAGVNGPLTPPTETQLATIAWQHNLHITGRFSTRFKHPVPLAHPHPPLPSIEQ